MAVSSFVFSPVVARRLPDPNFKQSHNAERHLLVVPVKSVPQGLPLDPNARRPNTNKRVYRLVEQCLLNMEGEPNTFHLKNKGITIIADSVQQLGEHQYKVFLKSGVHGIVDGGHTYKLICDNQTSDELPDEQYVQVEVRVGTPVEWIAEIAGGLNTSVQVQDMSLDNLRGAFEWIREELKSESYFSQIAWSENDPGEYDARDIISLLYMFNIDLFPNDTDDHPVAGYEKKSIALKAFEEKGDSFQRMKPILKDILVLHDTIAQQARDIWNKALGGRGGNLSWIESRKKAFDFYFLGTKGNFRVMNGALYPMLAAYRWYVERDAKKLNLKWRGGFPNVIKAWERDAPELLRATRHKSDELGRNPNAIGKSRPHWAALHTGAAKNDLMSRTAA